MLAFFLSPLGRKIAIYGGIAVVFLGALRIYGNRQYYAGREEEKAASSKILEESANKARDEARKELNVERETLATDRAALDQARVQFAGERKQVDTQIRARLNAIAASAQQGNNVVIQTPDGGLNDLVRAVNAELRTTPAQ